MDVYNPGIVSWWETQCYYHALAYLNREGVIICRPTEPYVCLGLHDDLDQEIDQEFCKSINLPLLRRETGGGVVYLDSRQIFYQVVLHRENHLLPLKRDKYFASVLQPAIDVCRSLGIAAELAPPADIKAGGRKCSGNAAGDIGQAVAYVGNLIIDFDFEMMSNVLKVPAPAYRRYLCRAMQDNMLTLADQVKSIDIYEVASKLISGFERIFGRLEEKPLDDELKKTAVSLRDRLTSHEWLSLPGRRSRLRRIKIVEGLFLQECESGKQSHVLKLMRDGEVEETYVVEKSRSNTELYETAETSGMSTII